MARPLRLEFVGALYHVTSRGDRQEPIFEDDEDRHAFLDVLGTVAEDFNWLCHAYCLMGNHYHLLVETPDGNLAKGMRQLNGVYTQRSNRRHRRVGHIFQGRYKAILVDKDSYLLELCRYVVLNPVRARLVKSVDNIPRAQRRGQRHRWRASRRRIRIATALSSRRTIQASTAMRRSLNTSGRTSRPWVESCARAGAFAERLRTR